MPRTTGPIQRVRPASAPTRMVKQTQGAAPRAGLTATTYQPPAGTVANAPQPTPSTACCCNACTGLECLDRTRFFSGQLLTEADLNNEQSYWLAKGRLHNRYLFGAGVVCGLQVSCSECDGWVTINPGYAIDPCGNDIIVCAGQSFNVIQAIQACCAPQAATDCSPLRYRPAATCQDKIQTWCITIQYQEQASRMVTPLQPSGTTTSSCGCGGGCTCGCAGSTKSNGCGCGGTSMTCSTSTSTTSSTAACEPTRINEGFQLGVCQAPSTTTTLTNKITAPQPGTYDYQFLQCYQALLAQLLAAPSLTDANGNPLSDQLAYQAVCQYLTSVKNAYASTIITHCKIETDLDRLTVPQPPQDNYIQLLKDLVKLIVDFILFAAFDCFCSSLVPPCPPDPCDNRLILACVTVQNGKITNICHFGGGRKQVVTFPVLNYWLSIFGFDKALQALGQGLELLCCGDPKTRRGLFNSDYSRRSVLLTGSQGNPASVNRAMVSYVAQKMGAAAINTLATNPSAIDLRPMVGLDTETVRRNLESYRIVQGNITEVDVSTDPAWTDAAIAAGASYAPAAFNAADPLTIYTRGKLVVGFDVTSPTDVLAAQVAKLQQQITDLNTQVSAMQAPPGDTGATAQKKPRK
jgi:hypothetical protein